MAGALPRAAAGLLAVLFSAATAHEEAELPPALSEDDECADGLHCGLHALQLRQGAWKGATVGGSSASRFGTCVDYGCGAAYVRGQRCQCNPDCHRHGNCCDDYADICAETRHLGSSGERGPVMTLYHQTSPEIGKLILKGGFKPGTYGWCGGAIYFATSPQATVTKAASIYSHRGFMIEAAVDLGKIKDMGPVCDMSMTGEKLWKQGFDSIVFNPIDGDEHVIYNSSQVLSTRHFPFPSWLR